MSEVLSFEKMKMLEKHSSVSGPLMRLFNERWMGVTPAVERPNHPEHAAWVHAANSITTMSQMLLELLNDGNL
jgi:hypothetical protein